MNWDWHCYGPGAVLPPANGPKESQVIEQAAPSIIEMAEDLEQYLWSGMLSSRGLVYEVELNILLFWLDDSDKEINKKVPGIHRPAIPKNSIAQVLVDILKKHDAPPFTLTPVQIYNGIIGGALKYILNLAVDGKITIYENIPAQDLQYADPLAHRISGKISKADWKGINVAVKFFNSYQPQLFRNELTLITLAQHPKLVQAYGGYCSEQRMYIVSELMEKNLYQILHKSPALDYNTKLKIALDIAEAMEFLHSRGIIHRNLKSTKILINKEPEIAAKVCGFGLSRIVDETSTMTGNVGTVAWIAPEIFQNKRYSEKCDVYSFGIVLYELLTQLMPFKELASFKIPMVVLKKQRPTIPPEVIIPATKDYIELMKECWHESPSKRPAFTQIIIRLSTLLKHDKMKVNAIAIASEDSCYFNDVLSSTVATVPLKGHSLFVEELRSAMGSRIHSKLITDDFLSRTLVARKGNVQISKKAVKSYLEWYQVLNHGKRLQISDVRPILEQKRIFVTHNAIDKEGRLIIYWDIKHNVESVSETELLKSLAYCLERVSERPEAKGVVIVGNFAGWTMANFSTRKHFPLGLHKVFFVDPPPWISRAITMSQPFIRSIISLIEIASVAKLHDHINLENLFPCMGGTLNFDVDGWIRSRYELEEIEYL